ncbi:MAG TPA: AraC family transcriptional regulator [Marinagarivorans sp.]
MPRKQSAIAWYPTASPEAPKEGTETTVNQEGELIDYDFYLSPSKDFPYAAFNFDFSPPEDLTKTVNIKKFREVRFEVACSPKNVLLFVLQSHDDMVTDPQVMPTRRVASMLFSCNETFKTVVIPFDHLYTPDWWLARHGRNYFDRNYRKDKVYSFSLVNSLDSPRATVSNVKVRDLKLARADFKYIYVIGALVLLAWVLVIVNLVRFYVREAIESIKAKVQLDRPFIAYKQLSIEPQRDKEKAAVLRYLATEYSNSELTMELMIDALGINRTKINQILKDELGLTFNAYLNKLRITEAARLLSEEDANVSEIAYSVGYNNVSYFNKLFKAEYSCTPKAFKSMYRQDEKNS